MKSGKVNRNYIYKRRFTSFVLNWACYIPILFPKWLVHAAMEREKEKDRQMLHNSHLNDDLKYISLLDGDFRWHKCTMSFLLTKNDLDLVSKWRKNFSLSGFDFDRYENLNDVSIVFGSSWNNLGTIRVNKENNFDELNSLYLDTKCIDYISIHLDKFGSGLYMMRYDVILNENTSKLIKNVEVGEQEFDVEFRSYNIFNKKNRGYMCLSRSSFASEKLLLGVNSVFQEVFLAWKALNKLMRIDVDPSKCSAISEFCILDKNPYFKPTNIMYDSELFVEIKRHHHKSYLYGEDNSTLIFPYDREKYPFDAMYIYNINDESERKGFPKFWPPSNRDRLISSFSFIIVISNAITELAKKIGSINYDDEGKQLNKKAKIILFYHIRRKGYLSL